ncbi:MAG: 5'-methylthioadenosine/S-adenosylhomocysteine nucleosidase [Bacteroidetes bacterium]|nr:5'-methylthioadenosine/S-adenosylhomocysteine nucleosidase [Bacteroidota bacterium]
MLFECVRALTILALCLSTSAFGNIRYAVLISANAEWKAVLSQIPDAAPKPTPFGGEFIKKIQGQDVLFFQGGWGKVSAAASTQYVIDHYNPEVLINLGTCGGFLGKISVNTTVLVNKTIIYDIMEAMGDSKEAIADYSTAIDTGWLGDKLPVDVLVAPLVSADRDLLSGQIHWLTMEFNAPAGDWESGAIAYTAARNRKRVMILRTVTDIVDGKGGEAYGNLKLFQERTNLAMAKLIQDLPLWIRHLESVRK